MADKQRHHFLGAALVIILALTGYTFLTDKPQFEVVEPTVSNATTLSDKQDAVMAFEKPVPVTHREVERTRTFYTPSSDVFEHYEPPKKPVEKVAETPKSAPKKLELPPIVAQVVAPVVVAAPPAPPPLPFRYLGKIHGDDEYIVFLGLQGKSLSVKMGETIQQTYRVEEIKPPLMQLTYLPLNIKQTIHIGEP